MWDFIARELADRPDYGYRWLGTVDRLDDLDAQCSELWLSPDRVLAELDAAEKRGLRLRVVPDLAALPASRTQWTSLGNVLLLDWRLEPLASGWAPTVKRVLDVLGSALALIVLAPLMALIALWVGLGSRGPILFRSLATATGARSLPFGSSAAWTVRRTPTFKRFRAMRGYFIHGFAEAISTSCPSFGTCCAET